MITKYNFHKDKCYLHSLYERRGKVNLSKMPIEKNFWHLFYNKPLPVDYQSIKSENCNFSVVESAQGTPGKRVDSKQKGKDKQLDELPWAPKLGVPSQMLPEPLRPIRVKGCHMMFMMLAPVEKRDSTHSIDSALDITWTQVIHFRSVFQITTF